MVVLLALALGPYAAPIDAIRPLSLSAALLRLGVVAAVIAPLCLVVRRSVAKDRLLALTVAATLLAAAVASSVFEGERGPLARGVWYVAPFAWGAVGAVLARARGRERGLVLPLGVTLVLGLASFAVARGRLGSREQLWKETLVADPGNEAASIAIAATLRGQGDRRAAYDALTSCNRVHPEACACGEEASSDAIDLGLYDQARGALEAPSRCPRTPRRIALTAEALVGTGAIDEGLRQADSALQADPEDRHAVYARAWGTMLKGGDLREARALAEHAVRLGRGPCANLLLGLIEFKLGDVDAAAPLFEAALRDDPTSVQAVYDNALVAQHRNRYHDAREGYLHALRIDPTFADARYNLVGLTLNAGAVAEAQHHLDELVARHPTDPRLPALRAALARASAPAPPPPGVMP